ncbi:winged helix-turn-helix domain-containing protein [Enterococcus quebecensis]|uniref:OmpR/PhoB-type domain-containing protein n=1 Tax=Enterococcus quebecensis TaxID=903983 RepID=A0A1E5H384_9ENTE|nr:winged helix-turn-helix domain-containing protein [Enterococcus quebecensis]OEG19275.1 hypothetical protein BCR23_00880 [Enterococcus quebecensis]OJG75811.1 hypothetical protein RV12_GL000150 [Enterococcus quebecensis]
MYNIGVASFLGTLSKEYMKKVNEIGQVHLIHQENIQLMIKEVDCIVIPDDSDDDNRMSVVLKAIIEIKAQTNKLVWVLTKETNSIKNLVFLKLGVDGVLPINDFPEEFSLVMENALHRQKNGLNHDTQMGSISLEERISDEFPLFELFPSNLSVIINGEKEICLTRLEYRTLEILYRNRNQAVSYKEIYETVWKDDIGNKQYRVANLIFHLRKKVEKDKDNPQFIKTVRSIGYRLSL